MITEEQATRLLKRADPARTDNDARELDTSSFLATLRARSTDVTFIDIEELRTVSDAPRRWRFVGLAAAAAVAAILVGALLVAGRGDLNEPQTPAATTSPTSVETEAEQVAMQYLVASDAGDGDTMRSLVADDATIIHNDAPASIDRVVTFERVREWRLLQPQCQVTSSGPPAEIRCTYLVQTAFAAPYGMGPFEGSSAEFEIAEGLIRRLEYNFVYDVPDTDDRGNWHALAYEAFRTWRERMYPGEPQVEDLDSPESIALLTQRIAEWQTVAPAMRFIQERNEWDGEAVRSMVADDAVIEGDFAVGAADDYVMNANFERELQWHYAKPRCTITAVGPPATVTCPYTVQNWLGRALDVGPYDGSSFEFEIADGLIRRVSHHWEASQYNAEVLEPFLGWLDEAHPGDRDVMFHVTDGATVPRMTPAALALFEARVREFVESVRGS